MCQWASDRRSGVWQATILSPYFSALWLLGGAPLGRSILNLLGNVAAVKPVEVELRFHDQLILPQKMPSQCSHRFVFVQQQVQLRPDGETGKDSEAELMLGNVAQQRGS